MMSKSTFTAIAAVMCTVTVVLAATLLTAPVVAEEFDGICGTVVTPAERAALLEKYKGVPIMAAPPAPPPATRCVPIAVHVVRKSDGTGGIPQSQLDQGLIDCNTHELYVNTNIKFYYLPGIDYIDDDNYYDGMTTQAELDALRGVNVVPNAINVYFVNKASVGSFSLCGISSFTTSAAQGIVMVNGCTGVASNPSSYPHEIGHYFDLFHTHETAFGVEFVDGTNCATTGDLLCDTPADPGLSGKVDAACTYTGADTDPNGDTYVPDPLQLMSYSSKLCRTKATPMGETRALNTLVIERPELLDCKVVLDIKPGSCPNPLNMKVFAEPAKNPKSNRGGVLPVAILGTISFDVSDIDVSTLLLEGVAPIRYYIEDVSEPGADGESCECKRAGPDGLDDLTLKFNKSEIAATLGNPPNGAVIPLTITGNYLDGTPFDGVDCVWILAREPAGPMFASDDASLGPAFPNPFNPVTRISYYVPKAEFVELTVYDVAGKLVAELVSSVKQAGEHVVEWDARGMPSGIYFYRLQVSDFSQTKKVILLK